MSFWTWLFGPRLPVPAAPIPPAPADALGGLTTPKAGIPVSAIGDVPANLLGSADDRFAGCVAVVLRHEGGFVDHRSDPGGATNHGISLRYARSQGSMFDLDGDGDVDRADILLVNPTFATAVYREWFWRDVRGDELPAGVDLAAFDFAVNSGPVRAIKALQRAIGADPDGFIGKETRAAIALAQPRKVVGLICEERLAFLRGLSTSPTFGKGWTARVQDIRARALEMVP